MSELTLNISVPVSGVNAILGALAKLPYEQVKVLLESIHAQATAQVEAANTPKTGSNPDPADIKEKAAE